MNDLPRVGASRAVAKSIKPRLVDRKSSALATATKPHIKLRFTCFDYLAFKHLLLTTWLSTIEQDLRSRNRTLPEAMDMAQNRSLWRIWSTYGATQS